MATTPAAPQRTVRRPSARGLIIFALAAVAVIVAAVVGIRGLLADPIVSVGADGTTTLHGTWEPYTCDATLCQGYVQAGSRSVFIVLPSGCPQPQRASDITITGRADTSLGKGSYRAVGCAG